MHEKRRYGDLVLHRVTEAMDNAQAKDKAADIRAEGYRARLDTWQSQFAVWSDKGLTDPSMPPRERKSRGGGGGGRRRTSSSGIQADYDKLVSINKSSYPLQKFKYDDRMWGWKGAAYTDSEKKSKTEVYTKQGYDVEWLSFKGSGIPLLYVAKWKEGKGIKSTSEQVDRAVGFTDTKIAGVVSIKRGGQFVTYKGQKWERHSCHLNVTQAREEAKMLVEEYNVKLFTPSNGKLICIYVRSKRLKSLDKPAVLQEVFAYLDRLYRAGVDDSKYPSVLESVYGMNPTTATRIVSRWRTDRKIGETPATHPGRKGVSKGVYGTKSERRTPMGEEQESSKGKPSYDKPRRMILLDPSFKNASQMSNTLGTTVDKVMYARDIKGTLLVLVKVKKQYRIYEVRRNTRGPNKGKLGERKLVDKFSVRTTPDGVEIAFRRELSKRGVQ